MKKFLTIFLILLTLTTSLGVLSLPNKVEAQTDNLAAYRACVDSGGDINTCNAQYPQGSAASNAATGTNKTGCSWWGLDGIICGLADIVSQLLLRVTALALSLVGLLFNKILDYTVVDMAKNLSVQDGIGESINNTWATLRDLANIVFIFVLLWAAIQTILELNVGKFGTTIRNIIIIALLINFSLFLTKVVIDASNIATIGFYNSINASAQNVNVNINTSGNLGTSTASQSTNVGGFSGVIMNSLGIQSWYGKGSLTGAGNTLNILVIGIMGSVTMLVLAVVMLVAAVLFIARFVLLVFLLILSPLAFIGYAIPAFSGKFKEWWNALLNQAFFAPYFMLLLWVAVKLIYSPGFLKGISKGGEFADIANNPQSTIGIFLNFVLVIGFIVGALILSKKMAAKTPYFDKVASGAGSVVVGGPAWAGRTTIGRAGKILSENATLQKWANEKTGFKGAGARLGLYASKTARSATFDARNATIPTNVAGDLIEGTVGRTAAGKKLGLNDVNIPGIAVGSKIIGDTLGKPGDKGYKERKEDSSKRVHDREAAAKAEFTLATAKADVRKGADAIVGSPEYIAMEKALAKLSDKETETLVASNRELLDKLNFANAISVKQLEAINKSDQFSEAEKNSVKGMRFKAINDAVAVGTPVSIGAVRTNIRNLTDSELEMIDSGHLENADFVSHLKSSQIEALNKGSKFTTSQKDKLRTARREPLMNALSALNVTATENALKALGPKEVASLDMPVLSSPTMMQAYNKQLLKRMAPEMNPADIPVLRATILAALPVTHPAHVWLTSTDGINNFS